MKKILFLTAGICLAVGIALALTVVILGGDTLFRQGIYTNTPTEKTFTVEDLFTSLSIEDVEGDITLLPSSDGTCRVDTVTVANTDYEIAVEDGTLTVRFLDHRRFLDRVGILAGTKLTVYLPQQTYESFRVNTTSGDVKVKESAKTVTAVTVSGDVTFDGTADTLTLRTTSGDVSVKGEMNALTVSVITGDISLVNTTADTLDAHTTSGDITLRSCDANDLSLKTTSGDITGSLRSPKNFSANATSGDISVPASDTAAGACRAETVSGDVKLTVENG